MPKQLELIGQANPKVLELVRDMKPLSPERISKEIYLRFHIDIGRNAVATWLKDEEERQRVEAAAQ